MSLLSRVRLLLTFGRGVARGLPGSAEDRDPLELFAEWWDAARDAGIYLPDSTALATSTPDGVPSVRMVLLKGLDPRGFVFYTNYESRKARELDANPRGALCFHWAVLERQVRVSGPVSRVSEEESAAYFRTRPRGSRIGAWASRQSHRLPERSELEARFRRFETEFAGGDIPLPSFWGGYRLVPHRLEFWQGRANRLHDRLVFERDGDRGPWSTHRLFP